MKRAWEFLKEYPIMMFFFVTVVAAWVVSLPFFLL